MASPTTGGFLSNSTQGCTNAYPVPTADFYGYVYHAPDGFCTPTDLQGNLDSPPWYSYNPGLATGAVFLTLFGILLILHTGLFIKSRRLWLVVLVIGAFGETLGWVGRLWSAISNNYGPHGYDAFLINIVCLTISPAFLSATAYGIYTLLVAHIDSSISRYRPRTLVKIFVGCDIFSLVLQATGGGIASGADAGSSTQTTGTNVFTAGIAFQLGSMMVFTLLTLEYLWIITGRQPEIWQGVDRKVKLLYLGNLLVSILVIIRGIYRTAELAEGWSGYIITHEGYFLAFDAAMILAALFTYVIAHPATLLPKKTSTTDIDESRKGSKISLPEVVKARST